MSISNFLLRCSIKKNPKYICKIAENTGYTEDQVRITYKYLFLDGGTVYGLPIAWRKGIVSKWNRLAGNSFTEDDKDFFDRTFNEIVLMLGGMEYVLAMIGAAKLSLERKIEIDMLN